MSTHRYSTESGEIEPADVRCCAIGKTIYFEHIGGDGDIFTLSTSGQKVAHAIAGDINAVLNGLRAALADSAAKAGNYAHEMSGEIRKLQAEIVALKAGGPT